MGNSQFEHSQQGQDRIFTDQEIKKLYKRFNNLDTDKSGQLEPKEFLQIPDLEQNPLIQRVIAIFDEDNDGKISFLEFLHGLSSLYGNNEEAKIRFAFQIFDINNDGFISNGELFKVIIWFQDKVLKMMVGQNLNDIQLQQLVDRTIIKADKDFDGKISYEEFNLMVKDQKIADKLTLHQI